MIRCAAMMPTGRAPTSIAFLLVAAVVIAAPRETKAVTAAKRPTQLEKADGGVVALPLHKMPWEVSASGLPVVRFWGDAPHSGFMQMLRLKAGERSYVHSHPEDKHGIVIEGQLSQDPVSAAQEDARKLGVVPSWLQPGGMTR